MADTNDLLLADTNDPLLVLELLTEGKINRHSFTQEQWRDILLKIISQRDCHLLEQLLMFHTYDVLNEVKRANKNKSTLFGETCLKHFDKNTVKILHAADLNQISKSETRQLIKAALSTPRVDHNHIEKEVNAFDTISSSCSCVNNDTMTEESTELEGTMKSFKPPISDTTEQLKPFSDSISTCNTNNESNETEPITDKIDSKSKLAVNDGPGCSHIMAGSSPVDESSDACASCEESRSQALNNLQLILTVCRMSPIFRQLLDLSDCEELNTLTSHDTAGWLYSFLRYGEMDIATAQKMPHLVLRQMESDQWEVAMETIATFDGDQNLLDKHISISFPRQDTGSDWTLLSYAIYRQRADIVQILLEHGAGSNAFCGRNEDGTLNYFTPFELAVEVNNAELCRLLVDNGANLYLQSTGEAGKILRNVIRHGNGEILKIILAHRRFPADMIIHYIDKLPMLQSNKLKRDAMKDMLRFCGANVRTDIFRALEKHDFETAKNYIAESDGATLNESVTILFPPHEGDWSLIVFAARINSFETIQLLRNKGISMDTFCPGDRNLPDIPYVSPLVEAILTDNIELCSKLLNNGAATTMFNGENIRRNCAWAAAFRQKNIEMYKLLLRFTADHGSIFVIFSQDCINDNFDMLSTYNIYEVFPLDVIRMIIKQGPLSVLDWMHLMIEASKKNFSQSEKKAKQMVLKLLLNFHSGLPEHLRSAMRLYSRMFSGQPPAEEVVYHRLVEIRDQCTSVPSLQSMCRYVIRNTCVSCEQEALHALGLPFTMEEYLQLPHGLVDPMFPQCSDPRECYL